MNIFLRCSPEYLETIKTAFQQQKEVHFLEKSFWIIGLDILSSETSPDEHGQYEVALQLKENNPDHAVEVEAGWVDPRGKW